MTLQQLFNDRTLKPKERTEQLSSWIEHNTIGMEELIQFAEASKDPIKATCMEALEFASQHNPAIITKAAFAFAVESLQSKAPRVKWESAKVIGNTAHLFTRELDTAICNLLINTEHTGTVVRWSAAFALGKILKLKTNHNKNLVPAVEALLIREEKNSIKKIYLSGLKET